MSERPTKVPAIPAPTNDNLLEVARAVKGVIDVREGLLGEIEDSFVKIRDLRDAKFRDKYDVGGDGAGSVGPPGSIPPPDLTPPPAPTGLTADPSLTSIILQWDSPPIGYAPNHAYTEVWRFTSDAIGSAVLIGTSLTQFYTDAVGDASTGFYYWVRFVSKADVDGPYNATPGVFAQTSPSPTKLLNLLTGQIRDSHLFSALGAPIRRIDIISDESAAASLANSLSIHRESTTRRSALLSEALERGTDITEVRAVVAVGDSQLASRIDTLTAVVSSNNATSVAAIQSEATVRANADSASAVRIDTLEVSVNTPTAMNNPTYAGLVAEAGVRAALDGSVQALYTVRTEISSGGRTVVGGFGLSGTATTTEGPRIDFGVRADRFWVGAPSSDSGIPDAIPFVIQTTPTTIGGESVGPGVYIDNAFIKNGSIGDAKVGTLTANKITAGYTASVDMEAGTFAGSEFYIGGTITYEFGNPSNPTQRTGIAAVAGANVAINALGATFEADYFRVLNSGVPYAPFEVSGGVVRIKVASIGDATITTAKIANTLQSTNFSPTLGWQINKAGTIIANEIEARGAIKNGTAERVATTMTGAGVNFQADATGCWGNAATNLTFDGSVMRMNGAWIVADNLSLGAFSTTISGASTKSGALAAGNHVIGTLTANTPTGGTAPYTYAWAITPLGNDLDNSDYLYLTGTMTNASVGLSGILASVVEQVVRAGITCVVTDSQGRTCTATRTGFLIRT